MQEMDSDPRSQAMPATVERVTQDVWPRHKARQPVERVQEYVGKEQTKPDALAETPSVWVVAFSRQMGLNLRNPKRRCRHKAGIIAREDLVNWRTRSHAGMGTICVTGEVPPRTARDGPVSENAVFQ
jgi:hypothetical protein